MNLEREMAVKEAGRRIVALSVLAIMVLASVILPGPRARVEITAAQASLLIETGPLRVQARIANELVIPKMLVLAIGDIAP